MRTLYIIAILVLVLIYIVSRRTNEYASDPSCLIPPTFTIDSGVPGPTIGILASVHGNEPAGAYTVSKMIDAGELKPTKGKLIIIIGNPCGIRAGVRENPYSWRDINRQFSEAGGHDETSAFIVKAFAGCDLILDFHEGWGWHLETKASKNPLQQISVGSTITPGLHPFWKVLAPKIVDNINVSIDEPLRKFSIIWNESCKIPQSLNCYALQNNIPYLLIETSGQENVQPMDVREHQVRTVIGTVLSYYGM